MEVKTNYRKKLKLLFVATEVEPYAAVGGLAAVMHALPRSLKKLGHDVRVMLPRYLNIRDDKYPLTMECKGLKVPTDNEKGAKYLICNVKKYETGRGRKKSAVAYFLENQEFYEYRANVYGYADDPVRWALLARGVLEFLKVSKWQPDIIVCSDWQTGFLPNYLRTVYSKDLKLSKISTVFSIHNLSYQGRFDHRFIQEMDFDDGHSHIPAFEDQRLLKINGMRRGIMYADVINTVSPTYAKEIMTTEFGEGLDELLRERRSVLYGILNGIDYNLWDPKKDPLVPNHFSINDLEPRQKNKVEIQNRFGLPIDEKTFLVSVVSRLRSQKGFKLLQEIITPLISELHMQMVLVGEGESELMKFFNDLSKEFPDQVGVHLRYDPIFPHIIFSGSDIVLIPSLFEPSGLIQMEAMRYGTVPLVRKTGGLADTVDDYSPEEDAGNGFVFEKFDATSLLMTIVRAYENFRYKPQWRKIQRRGMAKNYSWENSALQYDLMFQKAIEFHRTFLNKEKKDQFQPASGDTERDL